MGSAGLDGGKFRVLVDGLTGGSDGGMMGWGSGRAGLKLGAS